LTSGITAECIEEETQRRELLFVWFVCLRVELFVRVKAAARHCKRRRFGNRA
jgi:hypothetical protein